MMIYNISERRVPSADNDRDNYSPQSRMFPANGSLFVGQYLGQGTGDRHTVGTQCSRRCEVPSLSGLQALKGARDQLLP